MGTKIAYFIFTCLLSPSATYPDVLPLSSKENIWLFIVEEVKKQLDPAGSQTGGLDKHSLDVPQPLRVMLSYR